MNAVDILVIFILHIFALLFCVSFYIYIRNIQEQKKTLEKKLTQLQILLDDQYENKPDKPVKRIHSNSFPLRPEAQKENNVLSINIPTRGITKFENVGILTSTNTDDNIILPLFGKRTFNGSSNWNYYTTSDGYNVIDLSINYKKKDCMGEYGCDELNSNDIVSVQGYKHNFEVIINKHNGYVYVPY